MTTSVVRTTPATANDILRFLTLLWQPDDLRELRVPKYNKYNQTASGYFDAPEKLAAAAAAWDGKHDLYVTLNPVNPALLARAYNRINLKAEHTTADEDTARRDWLFLDIDPVRPAGISSTDEERAAAFDVLQASVAFLIEESWPHPVTAMSGNGYYALFPITLDNSPAATSLVESTLKTLADRFDTPAAHVDPSVSNASRIIGLIGSMKVRGDSIPGRPHRRSHLEETS